MRVFLEWMKCVRRDKLNLFVLGRCAAKSNRQEQPCPCSRSLSVTCIQGLCQTARSNPKVRPVPDRAGVLAGIDQVKYHRYTISKNTLDTTSSICLVEHSVQTLPGTVSHHQIPLVFGGRSLCLFPSTCRSHEP